MVDVRVGMLYHTTGFVSHETSWLYILHILAWASALPSDLDRAMREASERRMATDTDSYAFCLPNHLMPTRGRPRHL